MEAKKGESWRRETKESKISQQEAPIGAKTSSKAKLSKLALLKFPGDPTEWTTLRDSFSSAIHLTII